eukprot:scaffold26930_cov160-Skeletonema_menzelii.AAC.1
MKAFSSPVLLITSGLTIPKTVLGRSDIFCLTRDDCKQRQDELGLKKFKSGSNYGHMGRGCFRKFDTLYWSEGGSYEQKTTSDLGWSEKIRVTCGKAEQISTIAPTNVPTKAPTPAPVITVVTDTPTEETIVPEVDEDTTSITETEDEVATNSTPAGLSPNNYTEYQNSTSQYGKAAESLLAGEDLVEGANYTSNETDLREEAVQEEAAQEEAVQEEALQEEAVQVEAVQVEAVQEEAIQEEVFQGEVVEEYLTDSNQANTSYRLLEISVAVVSIGLILVAALSHRSRRRSKSQHKNNDDIADVTTRNPRPESLDIENGSADDNVQNTIAAFEAASEGIDGMGCWTPAYYNQGSHASSTSYGDGTSSYGEGTSFEYGASETMWGSIASESTYKEEVSVATSSSYCKK